MPLNEKQVLFDIERIESERLLEQIAKESLSAAEGSAAVFTWRPSIKTGDAKVDK